MVGSQQTSCFIFLYFIITPIRENQKNCSFIILGRKMRKQSLYRRPEKDPFSTIVKHRGDTYMEFHYVTEVSTLSLLAINNVRKKNTTPPSCYKDTDASTAPPLSHLPANILNPSSVLLPLFQFTKLSNLGIYLSLSIQMEESRLRSS